MKKVRLIIFHKKKKALKRIPLYMGILFFFLSSTFIMAQETITRISASIKPSIVTLETGQRQQFSIFKMPGFLKPAAPAGNIIWSVNGVIGGNDQYGRIDADGWYTAPAKVPSPHEVNISGELKEKGGGKLFATVLMAPDRPFYKSVFQYSEPLGKTSRFGNPHGVALDKEGNLIIVDADSHYVMRYSQDGKLLGYIGSTGQNDGEFYSPRVVLLDKDGDLYISDQKEFGNRIQIFSHDGQFKKSFAPKGNGKGQVLRAHGMNFDSEGNLYVVDVDNSRVTKFSHEGEYLDSWGKDGILKSDLNAPHGLVVDPNNDVFISGYYGGLQKFNPEGKFLFSFADANPPNGSVYIHAASGDKYGNVYAMVRGMRGYGGQFEVSREKIFSIEKHNNNGDFVCGINLSISEHSENWVYVDEKGYLFALFRSEDSAGFEILAPQ